MKFYCWNVNGFRAILKKGYLDWFQSHGADVISLQEVKAHEHQVDPSAVQIPGYKLFWNAAVKPGYSGTATWIKTKTMGEPISYSTVLCDNALDNEGRAQIFEFKDFIYFNGYFPNSQEERKRLKEKLNYMDSLTKLCASSIKKGKGIIVCGDYNIAHTEIDLKNPKTNQNTAGYYIEEREAMTKFLKSGMHDVFRERHPGEENHYSWWSYRFNAREKNVGWRIDLHCVSENLLPRVKDVSIKSDIIGSDHCPVYLELK